MTLPTMPETSKRPVRAGVFSTVTAADEAVRQLLRGIGPQATACRLAFGLSPEG